MEAVTQLVLSYLFGALSAVSFVYAAAMCIARFTVPRTIMFPLGITIFIITALITAGLPDIFSQTIYWALAICGVYLAFRNKVWQQVKVTPENIVATIGIISFLILNVRSGLSINGVSYLYGNNAFDSMTHRAYAAALAHQFPSQHPFFGDLPLTGYHFFYPLSISFLHTTTLLSYEDILFRVMPLLIVITYATGIAALARCFTSHQSILAWIQFFAFFGAHNALLFTQGQQFYTAWEDPIGLFHNPSALLSIGIVGGILSALATRTSNLYIPMVTLGLAILPMTKIYTAIIAYSGCLAFVLYRFTHKTIQIHWRAVISIILGIMAGIALYIPFNAGAGGLVFEPLRFFEHFMEQPYWQDKWHWKIEKDIFTADQNYLRITILYIMAICTYLIINIGNRWGIIFLLKNAHPKFWWNKSITWMLASMIGIGILIPVFFVQTTSAFDIAQFIWVITPFLAIPAACSTYCLLQKNPFKFTNLVLYVILLLPPLTLYWQKAHAYILSNQSSTFFTNADQTFFQQVQKAVPLNKYIIMYSAFDADGNPIHPPAPYLTAMTERSAYYERATTQFAQENLARERTSLMHDLYTSLQQCDLVRAQQKAINLGTPYIVSVKPLPCVNQFFVTTFNSPRFWFYQLYEEK